MKRINLQLLLVKHSNLRGIDKFEDDEYLKSARIGIFGEIYWPDTITNSDGDLWNYDISPEFVAFHGEDIS
ncbi:MAG: hypothetical protein WAU01_06130 [Saprospiraceae bacterium]